MASLELSDDNDSQSYQDLSSSADEDAQIHALQPQKSRQTKKRKVRASQPSAFGATLQSLLSTQTPTVLPLSLKPSIGRKQNDEKLEQRAKKALQLERKELEDKGRITDVIGGWGVENERSLRKVAQRGVVQLFNAVQQSQLSSAHVVEQNKKERGTGKASLPAPAIESKGKRKRNEKDNPLGRGKGVDKDEFFDIIKAGGFVAKS